MKLNKKLAQIGLKKSEKVLLVFRKHWMALVIPFLTALMVAAIPLVILLFELPKMEVQNKALIFVFSILLAVYLAVKQLMLWRNDVYYLTENRLFRARTTFFHQIKEKEVLLKLIRSISATKPNLLAHIFGYGKIRIGSTDYSNRDEILVLRFVAHTERVIALINNSRG